MMNQSLQGTVAPRSQDELEGTLLLAREVDEDDNAPSAAPTAHYQYEDATVDIYEAPDLPTAPLVPKFDNLEDRERAEAQKLALGKLHGLQQAELAREQLERANIQTFTTNYHASAKVAEANRLAIQRNIKGVEIEKDTWFGHEKPVKSEDNKTPQEEPAFASSEDGGYKVTEYQMDEYKPNDEYQFSEYKSVYDK